MWKAVQRSKDLLQRGLRWNVMNRRRTQFWIDVWLDHTLLKDLALGPIDQEQLTHKVRDYWMQDRGWI